MLDLGDSHSVAETLNQDALRSELAAFEAELQAARSETQASRQAHGEAEVALEAVKEGSLELVENFHSLRAMLRQCQAHVTELETHGLATMRLSSDSMVAQAKPQDKELRQELDEARSQLEHASSRRQELSEEIRRTRAEIRRVEEGPIPEHQNTFSPHYSGSSPNRPHVPEATANALDVVSSNGDDGAMKDSSPPGTSVAANLLNVAPKSKAIDDSSTFGSSQPIPPEAESQTSKVDSLKAKVLDVRPKKVAAPVETLKPASGAWGMLGQPIGGGLMSMGAGLQPMGGGLQLRSMFG